MMFFQSFFGDLANKRLFQMVKLLTRGPRKFITLSFFHIKQKVMCKETTANFFRRYQNTVKMEKIRQKFSIYKLYN